MLAKVRKIIDKMMLPDATYVLITYYLSFVRHFMKLGNFQKQSGGISYALSLVKQQQQHHPM